jgi:hypothetical protein
MLGQPALDRVALAILLLRPVLKDNEFRRQGQDMLVAGCDDAGAQERMEIFGATIRTLARRAARAMDLARAAVFGASSATSIRPPGHLNGVRTSGVSMACRNSGSNAAVGAPSSISRI